MTTASNLFSGNTTDERVVTSAGVLAPAAATNQKAKGVDVVGTTYCTIQKAVDKATAGQTANVYTASYDEQVLVNKSMTIDGASPKPVVDFTGTVSGKATLFDVSAQNVVLRDLDMRPDLVKLSSAVDRPVPRAWAASAGQFIHPRWFHGRRFLQQLREPQRGERQLRSIPCIRFWWRSDLQWQHGQWPFGK